MKIKRVLAVFALLFLISVLTVHAEAQFGVKIPDGAQHDAATSKMVSESMSVNASCYRTSDSVAKVTEFYKKQPDLKFIGGDNEGAMFKKGDIDITVQNPWMDLSNGQLVKETLISIVKQQP